MSVRGPRTCCATAIRDMLTSRSSQVIDPPAGVGSLDDGLGAEIQPA